jgi:tRNA A-37 threonylcarbamoyl transferase component Bud32
MMGSHKRKLEQAADDMLILEQISNSSLMHERKERMMDRVDDGFVAQMNQEYGSSWHHHH